MGGGSVGEEGEEGEWGGGSAVKWRPRKFNDDVGGAQSQRYRR